MKFSFDIESIFHHIGDSASYQPKNVFDYIINILSINNIKATFFVVSDYANAHPWIVKSIIESGHEIGSHSKTHANLKTSSRAKLINELHYSKKNLEDLAGCSVVKFRAPAFNVPADLELFFDDLLANGYNYDSSIIQPNKLIPDIIYSKKLYISYVRPIASFFGRPILAGGKYSRVIPFFILKGLVRQSQEAYFHLHDFDPNVSMHKIKKISTSKVSHISAMNSRKFFELLCN